MRGADRVKVQRRVEIFESLDFLCSEGSGVAECQRREADVEEGEDGRVVGGCCGGGEEVRGEDGGGAEAGGGEEGGEVGGGRG